MRVQVLSFLYDTWEKSSKVERWPVASKVAGSSPVSLVFTFINTNMTILIHKYFVEIHARISYILISLFLSMLVSYTKLNTLILLCLHPLLKVDKYHKFIAIELNEFFITAIYIIIVISLTFTFPLICWHTLSFLKSGWHDYQSKDLIVILYSISMIYVLLLTVNYFFILPIVYKFFLYGLNSYNEGILKIITESRILYYTKFVSKLLFFLSNLSMYFSWVFIFIVTRNHKSYWLYYLLKHRKVVLLFIIIVNSFFFFDYLLFVLSVFVFIIYYYVIVYILCLFL